MRKTPRRSRPPLAGTVSNASRQGSTSTRFPLGGACARTIPLSGRLCAALDPHHLAEDPRFRGNQDRVVHRKELVPLLAAIFATRKRADWAERLEAAGIPNGPINTLDQVVADAQTRALGIIQTKPGSELGLVGLPLSFDGIRPPFAKAAPGLGEDNDAQLG